MKIKDDEKKILKYRLALTQEPQIQAFQEMDIAIESLKQLKNQESISAAEILDVNLKMRHNTFENRMEKKPNDYNIVLPTIEDILNYVPPETRNNIKLTEKDVKLQELLEMIEKLEVEHSLHYKNEFQKNEQELVEIQNLILAEQESFRKNIISVKMESEKLNEISKRSILNRQKALIETANSFFGESE
jgi:Zn-dependent M32 family carboxypeptidase